MLERNAARAQLVEEQFAELSAVLFQTAGNTTNRSVHEHAI
jgi:hypothetical protein